MLPRPTRYSRPVFAAAILLLSAFALVVFPGERLVGAAGKQLAWDEDPASTVTGFAVWVDGVRTDYGLTPQPGGACGCSISLPFTSGRHTLVVSAYNSWGEALTPPFIAGPTANAGGPYTGQAATTLSVSASGSTDNLGTITSYVWIWGDGTANTSSASPTASHAYAGAGAYTITLIVNDDFPASDSTTATATIAAPPPPSKPASPNPANGATGVSLTPPLTWTATNATSYDVRFGTATPPPQVVTGQSAAAYTPTALTSGTTYYWQIVARGSGGATTGPIWSLTTAPSAPPPASDVVIYASDIPAGQVHGAWVVASDTTSPNGLKLVTADLGAPATSGPRAAPTDYVDVSFTADMATPYTLWLRVRALGNSKFNDSLWVQFSDALVNGSAVYPINSTNGLLVNLPTDASGASLNGWGWKNGAYWLAQPATVTFATAGSHTLRLQVREDGVEVDQIVLSPNTYLTAPPGPPTSDSTIVRK